jgi:transcriptional regulator with XRE-family HTH domain
MDRKGDAAFAGVLQTVMIGPKDIGRRVRELRQREKLSLRGLAQKSGVAVSFLSRIEAGTGSPTLATLLKIMESLDVSASDLFAAAPDEWNDVIVQRKTGMQELDDGDKCWRFLFPSHRAIRTVMTYEEYRPGTRNVEQESHPFDVCGLVIGGTLTLQIPDRPAMDIRAGDSFYIRANTPHAAVNRGRAVLRMVVVELRNAQSGAG